MCTVYKKLLHCTMCMCVMIECNWSVGSCYPANEENNENLCAYYDDDNCTFAFVYSYDNQAMVVVRAQEERECPPQV